MGHSNLNVSLTYLRGLDVAELKESECYYYFSHSSEFYEADNSL